MNVAGCVVPLNDTIKLLGVTIDHDLTFDAHVHNVCKSAYYRIRAVKHIRLSLSTDMAKTVASALVNLRLDYTDSVLYTQQVQVAGSTVDNVESFTYLGSLIDRSGRCEVELVRWKECMTQLDRNIWHSNISLSTKIRLYSVYILPVFLYGAET